MKVHILIDHAMSGSDHIRVFETMEDLIEAYIDSIKKIVCNPEFFNETIVDLKEDKELKSEHTRIEMLRALTHLPYDSTLIDMEDFLFHYTPDMQYHCTIMLKSNKRQKK